MSKFEFKMPKLGESITEAAIITWFKSVGDFVEKDEMLLEVATDKVDSEVPSTVSGTISEILFEPNAVIKIGEVIAIIDANGEKAEKESVEKKPIPKVEEKTEVVDDFGFKQVLKKKYIPTTAAGGNNKFFSPLIISIAKEHHISFDELARIPARGKDGRLRKSDVYAYLKMGRPFKFAIPETTVGPNVLKLPDLKVDTGQGKVIEMDRMRSMIADHMVYSKLTSPHVTSYAEADLTDLVAWRNENKAAFQKKHDQKLTYTPLFIEAVVKAIKDFPMINVSVDGKNIIVKEGIHIGLATALPNGNLIVPVIKDADKKNLTELAIEVNDLVNRARTNTLKPDEVGGSTFTISNVGTFGSLMGTPIINQPEVAILALGIIKKRPEVLETDKGDEIAIRQMMFLSLSFDHRVVDGHLGGSFLKRITEYLEQFDLNRTLS